MCVNTLLRKVSIAFTFLVALGLVASCTAALDFDALSAGKTTPKDSEEDTDSAVQSDPCTRVEDCDDGIDCTNDSCSADGYCVREPSNAKCPGFEICRAGEGCVDIGRECLSDDDCDDGVDCTRDNCTADGKCEIVLLDDDVCNDGSNLCIQDRTCDAEQGCIGGREKTCEQIDGPYCYNYFCAPATGKCDDEVFRPGADEDGDGYCDADPLFNGDDCDDENDAVHPNAEEILNNQIDDDCDGETDEAAAR